MESLECFSVIGCYIHVCHPQGKLNIGILGRSPPSYKDWHLNSSIQLNSAITVAHKSPVNLCKGFMTVLSAIVH